jgi:hypothetical protein
MRALLFFIAIMITDFDAYAQANKGSVTFQAAFPGADNKNSYDVIPTGMMFAFTHQLKNQPPFSFGAEIGILQVNGADKHYTGVFANEYNNFLVASWNHIITVGGTFDVNLFPENSFFNAIVGINAGTNLFITTTSISRYVGPDPVVNAVAAKSLYSGTKTFFALRMGGEVAIEIPVGRKKKICALVKGSYLYGSHANYYSRPDIVDTKIILSPRSSGTSMILTQTGIKFYLFTGPKKQKE